MCFKIYNVNNQLKLLFQSNPVAGSIVKIELQNFMCHTFFEIELSPSVNFIVGRNGSKFQNSWAHVYNIIYS